MKFDVVIGNPPYKGDLHLKFLELSYNISDFIIFLEPGGFYFDKKNKNKNFIRIKELIKDSLEEVIFFNGNYIFNVVLHAPFSISIINKLKKNNFILVNNKIFKTIDKIKDINYINKWNEYKIYPVLEKKILEIVQKDNFYKYVNKKVGNYYINLPKITGHVIHLKESDKFFKKDYFILLHKKTGKLVNEINRIEKKPFFISFKTEEEGNNCLLFLKSRFARFCLSIYKNNMHIDGGELKSVPWLDWNKEWTEEKIKDYFELTDEEIRFINKVIPEYY